MTVRESCTCHLTSCTVSEIGNKKVKRASNSLLNYPACPDLDKFIFNPYFNARRLRYTLHKEIKLRPFGTRSAQQREWGHFIHVNIHYARKEKTPDKGCGKHPFYLTLTQVEVSKKRHHYGKVQTAELPILQFAGALRRLIPGAALLVSIYQSDARRLETNCEMMGTEHISERDENMTTVIEGIP